MPSLARGCPWSSSRRTWPGTACASHSGERLVRRGSTIWAEIMGPNRQGTPFPFEGPVPPELLIDRSEELDLLARRAADRVGVRLVAPRRYGKTSLVLAHAAR